jgi:hypothetical protein
MNASGQLLICREIGKVRPSTHMDGLRVYRDLTGIAVPIGSQDRSIA